MGWVWLLVQGIYYEINKLNITLENWYIEVDSFFYWIENRVKFDKELAYLGKGFFPKGHQWEPIRLKIKKYREEY